MFTTRFSAPKREPTNASGTRHQAARVIGPVAVEADHTPFDPPGHPEPTTGLADRIMERPLAPVRDERNAIAEPARDRLRGPGAECRLANALDAENLEVGLPVLAFLVGEPGAELVQHARVVAQRHERVVARTREVEVELVPVRGRGRRGAAERDQTCDEQNAAEHVGPP